MYLAPRDVDWRGCVMSVLAPQNVDWRDCVMSILAPQNVPRATVLALGNKVVLYCIVRRKWRLLFGALRAEIRF